ncbi:NAD(+) diphosphatase [Leucobacter sp. cx-328]|uniref:NAD(+) diphosphatase n=1 Tax=unclassified Leucobacter TaxID=2621730 RepID=UPI00165E3568|nr:MULTISPECIES: NAD(+) diphosphatase [unclassified Leucobacter]MBC9944480.1 NAD(+) diphosphatase [Leucobacter sp. cx-328]
MSARETNQTGGVPLGAGYLDRDSAIRTQPAALDAAWASEAARMLELRAGQIPLRRESADVSHLVLGSTIGDRPEEVVFIGRMEGAAVFARELPAAEAAADQARPTDPDVEWAHPFARGTELPAAEREIVTIAAALLNWHRTAGFSPQDGTPTTIADGGWSRRDANGAELFPRMDPAVIVIVEHDNKLLLGSNALWESGRFSLLAGYIDAGETAEHAVEREMREEAGARVTDITYVASQPWPFPRSLMLGFRAKLAADQSPADLVADPAEISELRWFTRDELRHPPVGVKLPGELSIAGWLVQLWLNEGDEADEVDECNASNEGNE